MDSPSSKTLQKRSAETPLARVLREQGRRQDWVADMLGVSQTAVARWVSGERGIIPARIAQLAELLGVPEQALR